MIYLQVPWAAVGIGAEVVAPDGLIWTVTDLSTGNVELSAGGRKVWRELLPSTGMVMAVLVVRDTEDAIAALGRVFKDVVVLGRKDEAGQWVSPFELTPVALADHLTAFHAVKAKPAFPSRLYSQHAELHQSEHGIVGGGTFHVHA